MKEKEVARKSDLEAHKAQDWRQAHGIWPGISDPAVSILQSKAKFRAYLSTAQNNLATSWSKILLDGVTFNPGGYYSTSTKRFTAPVPGYYQFHGGATATSAVNNEDYLIGFFVNGTCVSMTRRISSYNFNLVGLNFSDIIYLEAGDYVELQFYNGGGATAVDLTNNSMETFFSGHILSVK